MVTKASSFFLKARMITLVTAGAAQGAVHNMNSPSLFCPWRPKVSLVVTDITPCALPYLRSLISRAFVFCSNLCDVTFPLHILDIDAPGASSSSHAWVLLISF